MIKSIKHIRNVGRFGKIDAQNLEFSRFTLIHAENGRGKTTLSTILRSLSQNEGELITARARLGESEPPKVVLDLGNNDQKRAVFEGGKWRGGSHSMAVYDDRFIADNISSGLTVANEHRKRLYDLVVGEEAVKIAGNIQELGKLRDEHNTAARGIESRIVAMGTHEMPFEQFRSLQENPNVESVLEDLERNVEAAKRRDEVENGAYLTSVNLPTVDLAALEKLLSQTIDDLDRAAAEHVRNHAERIGEGGEEWLGNGVAAMNASSQRETCPFCGQPVSGLSLVEHYRTYFGSAYQDLKRAIADTAQTHDNTHGADARNKITSVLLDNARLELFWSDFCNIESGTIESTQIAGLWSHATAVVKALLAEKRRSPLEKLDISDADRKTVEKYHASIRNLDKDNESIARNNAAIGTAKGLAVDESIDDLREKIRVNLAIRDRHRPEYASLFEAYRIKSQEKADAVKELQGAKAELEEHRNNSFAEYETGVNENLERFGAGFRLKEFTFQDRSSGPTSRYDIDIMNHSVPVRAETKGSGVPTFENTLSAGDRATLALALFFETTRRRADLADLTVVIDDPASSLDDHRISATIEELVRLGHEAGQVIVMSHRRELLAELFEREGSNDCVALRLERIGEESKIAEWDIASEAATRHDERFALFSAFQEGENVDRLMVAQALRLHLEGFVRVAYPGQCPAGGGLTVFLSQSGNVLKSSDDLELRNLVKFANRFHHGTNPNWQSETIDDAGLLSFVERVLRFTRR